MSASSRRRLAPVHALLLLASLAACGANDASDPHADHAAPGADAPLAEAPSPADADGWSELEGGTLRRVRWRAAGGTIPRNESFDLELLLLDGETPRAVEKLVLRGWMPDHGHGFAQKPTVVDLGEGRYRAEGVLLHMRGEWLLHVDLFDESAHETLTLQVSL